jgi:hypothetical protein
MEYCPCSRNERGECVSKEEGCKVIFGPIGTLGCHVSPRSDVTASQPPLPRFLVSVGPFEAVRSAQCSFG